MKNKSYWQARFETLEKRQNRTAGATYNQIAPAFDKAQAKINKEIEHWYQRIADNNEISLADAKKLLTANELKEFKWTVEDYIKYGQENALDGAWMKELENASAKFHISRLEALKLNTQQQLEVAFGNQLDAVDAMCRKVYENGYYRTAFEIMRGNEVGFNIGKIDTRQLDKIISKPWAADGSNFSDRIWNSKTQMVTNLHQQLTRTCILGGRPDEAIKAMEAFVDKECKNAKRKAARLVQTEQAFFASEAQRDCFKDLDVEEFEFVASLDEVTCEICGGMDGHHLPMKDFEPGSTAPPLHPFCRCVTVPYFNDEWAVGERAARNEEGKTYYVPESMTYKEWQKEYVMDATSKADKEQYRKYKEILQERVPKTLAEFVDMKYNNSPLWETTKELVRLKRALQVRFDYIINGEKLFLPQGAAFSKIKTIAGAGTDNPIRDVNRLVSTYNIPKEQWKKQTGQIKSAKYTFDMHWYECDDGIQREMKMKYRKENKS